MIPCTYCEKLVPETEKSTLFHDACRTEYDRRLDAGLCKICGKNAQSANGEKYLRCDDCLHEWTYKGYPSA